MNGLSLCSGIGGLELGLRLALGSTYRTVCMVEGEAYCVEVLMRRMQEGLLDQSPIWDDLTTFPCEDWRGKVDIVSAGFPCQPSSCAGQRKGTDDERWLWPHIKNIIRKVGPEWIFLENVRGLLSVNSGRGFAEILGGLADLGYDAEWMLLSAGECGATHRRERIFILAHSGGVGRGRGPEGIREVQGREIQAEGPGGELADAGQRSLGKSTECKLETRWDDTIGGRPEVAIAQCSRWEKAGERRCKYSGSEPETRGGELGNSERKGLEGLGMRKSDQIPTWPPGPADRDRWAEILERWPELAPAMEDAPRIPADRREAGETSTDGNRSQDVSRGRDEPDPRHPAPSKDYNGEVECETESPVRRMAHGPANRVDRLRACGNAVVPVVACEAFKILYERMTSS